MQSDKIIAGIDIESESVQISWFGGRLSEPETVSMQVGVDKFKIPFARFIVKSKKIISLDMRQLNVTLIMKRVFLYLLFTIAALIKKMNI